MYTFSLLCALGLVAALAVPSTSASEEQPGGETVAITPDDQQEIVDKHNSLRGSVFPPATNMLQMSWNNEAAVNAEKRASICSLKNSFSGNREITTSSCGQNMFLSTTRKPWSHVIQSWYDEVKDWRYGVGSVNGNVVGHFTQVVWYRSHQVGCAVAHCPNSFIQYFYVCHYCPSGNTQFTHPYKAGPTCHDCPSACKNNLCPNTCPHYDQYQSCPALKNYFGCDSSFVATKCPASCKCINQII